ncbi:MAG: 5-deoxy-glucuronate isomerase [Spirochaetes bacterium GWF1_41_5]|nr:MAG: 5-deoxy-glucuronate isomerase [Spirochaetes bacterium GWF1_41_5]HBE01339.1 5-deoxy-glucuronate isomerase [Spirochaetia bacterium]
MQKKKLNLLCTYQPAPGLVAVQQDCLSLIKFGIINLTAGKNIDLPVLTDRETALVVLSGVFTLNACGKEFIFGERKDVFSGKPFCAYIPAGSACSLKAQTGGEIAVTTAPGKPGKPFRLLTPGDSKEKKIGRDNFTRTAFIFLDDEVQADNLFIGEAIVPSGNWASFPPHRHDFDNLPVEVDMEELYFFRFNPPNGFGIQKSYNDSRSLDETVTVRHNQAVCLTEGYHPVVNAPGYTMYYLWIMAGKNRKFLSVMDSEHAWIVK